MIKVRKEGLLLNKTTLSFECEGVLNPAIVEDETGIHLFYRAVREGNYSTIGCCTLRDPLTVDKRQAFPLLEPTFAYESHGVEDPRLVKIDGVFYLTYTAYDGVNALGALAISTDLKHFEKKGIIVPQVTYREFSQLTGQTFFGTEHYLRYNGNDMLLEQKDTRVLVWDKNVVFFPERIHGKIFFLHRIKPEIQIACIDSIADLTPAYWGNYLAHFDQHILLTSKYKHEESYIGSGCPPVKTRAGWLLIYHAVHYTPDGYVYSACAALLDLDKPNIEIARLPYPLFVPDREWEKRGAVNNVCFPTGTLTRDGTLFIYYGAADQQIACATVNLEALIDELLLNTVPHDLRN